MQSRLYCHRRFLFFVSGHQWASAHVSEKTEEGAPDLLACGGAGPGQTEVAWRAGGRVKIKEFHRPARSRLVSARPTPCIPTARPFSHFTQHWDSKSRLQTWAGQASFGNNIGLKPQTNNCLKQTWKDSLTRYMQLREPGLAAPLSP